MRYLIKRNGKYIDYMQVPKRLALSKIKGGYKISSSDKEVMHKGYRLVEAKSFNELIKGMFGYFVKVEKVKIDKKK